MNSPAIPENEVPGVLLPTAVGQLVFEPRTGRVLYVSAMTGDLFHSPNSDANGHGLVCFGIIERLYAPRGIANPELIVGANVFEHGDFEVLPYEDAMRAFDNAHEYEIEHGAVSGKTISEIGAALKRSDERRRALMVAYGRHAD